MPRLLFALPLLALGACAIPSSRSNIVVVTENKAVVEPCKRVGDVDGGSGLGGVLLLDQARDSALARLKIRTAELGGTHVLSPVAVLKWNGASTAGVAYSCPG